MLPIPFELIFEISVSGYFLYRKYSITSFSVKYSSMAHERLKCPKVPPRILEPSVVVEAFKRVSTEHFSKAILFLGWPHRLFLHLFRLSG